MVLVEMLTMLAMLVLTGHLKDLQWTVGDSSVSGEYSHIGLALLSPGLAHYRLYCNEGLISEAFKT